MTSLERINERSERNEVGKLVAIGKSGRGIKKKCLSEEINYDDILRVPFFDTLYANGDRGCPYSL